MVSPRIKRSTFFPEEGSDDLFLLQQRDGDILCGDRVVDASSVPAPITQADSQQRQALDPDRVRQGPKHILLGPAGLYETLRGQGGTAAGSGAAGALRPGA